MRRTAGSTRLAVLCCFADAMPPTVVLRLMPTMAVNLHPEIRYERYSIVENRAHRLTPPTLHDILEFFPPMPSHAT
jgi:hypothetical protein